MPEAKKDRQELITLKQIWTINFATAVLLLISISVAFISRIDLQKSDKDIILVYVVILIGLYLVVMTTLFYNRIYHWGTKSRLPFYFFATLTAILSFIMLYIMFIYDDEGLSPWKIFFATISGLNFVTYFWGQLSARS
jgi:hypothetical protein